MVNVRAIDFERDINEVSNLLSNNFTTNKTKEQFIWKHLENPFGKSYGLVALDNEKIVGLRMFMRWEFLENGKILKAIRPVDTCTDVSQRGKGIFKKLTTSGLLGIKGEYDLIFNTPNQMSYGGYLKMGWTKIPKRIQYKIGLTNPFSKRISFKKIGKEEIVFDSLENKLLCQTNISREYLKWRYRYSKYKKAIFADDTMVFYKIEKIKGFKALILLNIFNFQQDISVYLNSIAIKSGVLFSYFLDNEKLRNNTFPVSFLRGEQVVVSREDEKNLIKKIDFSAGDLDRLL